MKHRDDGRSADCPRSQGGGLCSMDEIPSPSSSEAARSSASSDSGPAEPLTWAVPSSRSSRRAAGGLLEPDPPLVPFKVASPKLGDELFARLVAYGTPQ